jgi:glycosyltransferase involved in cell wall biosynthesis
VLKGESIVILASMQWDDPPNTPRQIATVLARSNRVLYVEMPASYIHLRDPKKNNVWYRWMFGLRPTRPSLWVWTPPPSLPWKTRWPPSNRITQRYIAPFLKRVIKRLEMPAPILLTFLPHHCDLMGRLPHKLICYYCIDEWKALTRFVRPATIQRYEDRLAPQADLVFATSRSLASKMLARNPDTHLVPNGVDFNHYQRALDPSLPVPPDIQSIRRPILGFSGLFDFRIDQPLLCGLARARPDWSLVFVGPQSVDARALRSFANVHFLGNKPVADLPAYFGTFDVALIPYVLNLMTASIYPAKLNEYFAAGLPVVSTTLPELADFVPLVHMARHGDEFLQQVEHALSARTGQPQSARLAFARQNTWEERAETISSCIVRKLRERYARAARLASV